MLILTGCNPERLAPFPQSNSMNCARAISLWKKGFNRRRIGTLLEVHYNTVGRWVCTYEIEGKGALRSAKRRRKKGGSRNLTPRQEKEIQKVITDKTPDQLKMPFALWTRRAVCELVEERCTVRLPERTCGGVSQTLGLHCATSESAQLRAKPRGGATLD